MHPYLNTPTPHVLAHQGLALDCAPNSLAAFAAALEAGADYIETDAHGTKDGIAVLFHDDELNGVPLSKYLAADLPDYIPTLEEALVQFSETKFNIDIKNAAASVPVAQVINSLKAHERVLLTSFSAQRRKVAMKLAPGTAASPAVSEFAPALFAATVGVQFLVNKMLRKFDAVQIPAQSNGIKIITPKKVRMFHNAGVLVHVWTINDPAVMKELIAAGVDGIVTDKTDVAVKTLKS